MPGPVLLLHGWGGHAGHLAALVDPLVAAGFQAAAVDAPGHGESAGRQSSLLHFAAVLERAAALLGPVRAVVAHSLGAAATTWAMAGGLPVERAVYFAPVARFEHMWGRFRAASGVADVVWDRVVRESEAWIGARFDDLAPMRLAPTMRVPLLVLHATDDRDAPFGEGAELAARWPGATLRPVEGLGHLRILADHRCIAETVAFVSG